MAFGTNGQLWPNATIPFEIDSGDFPIGSADRRSVEDAINHWNNNSVIRLIPRSGEVDFVVFTDTGTQCQSGVGRRSGQQVLTCDLEANFNAGNVMHEIGHVVGFFHEQKRPDRGSFVTVGSNSDATNCAIRTGERILTDYDCDSIMHYGTGACGGITPVAGGCANIGQRTRLSGRDIWGASLLYDVPMRSVVVWADDSDNNTFFQVHASGFSESGRRCCGPLTVNKLAANQQHSPAVGMAGNRDLVFVWADDTDGNNLYQIKLRCFGANGRQRISQRTVNTTASGNQIAPDVAVHDAGHFVVVWQDDMDGNNVYQIKARGFNSDGSERFSQRTVNTRARGQQKAPCVAIAPDGFFVVAWEDTVDNVTNIRMRGFRADGTERWNEIRVNGRNRGSHKGPRIAMGPFGDFVVVWADDADGNGLSQIRMRAFTADGHEKFSERTVNETAAGQQFEPDVAVDDVFRPVVVWADDRDRNGFFQIRMRGFESDGTERISERTVNTDSAGQQRQPSIGMEASGRFTVAWVDDPDNDGLGDILVRGFSANGEERFTTQQVSNISGGHKGNPRVAAPAMSLFDPFNPF